MLFLLSEACERTRKNGSSNVLNIYFGRGLIDRYFRWLRNIYDISECQFFLIFKSLRVLDKLFVSFFLFFVN